MFEKSSDNKETKDLDHVITLNNQDTSPTLQRSPRSRNLPELLNMVKTEDQNTKLDTTQNLSSEKVLYTEDFDKSFLPSNPASIISSPILEAYKSELLSKDQNNEYIDSSSQKNSSLIPTLTENVKPTENLKYSLDNSPTHTPTNSPNSPKKSPILEKFKDFFYLRKSNSVQNLSSEKVISAEESNNIFISKNSIETLNSLTSESYKCELSNKDYNQNNKNLNNSHDLKRSTLQRSSSISPTSPKRSKGSKSSSEKISSDNLPGNPKESPKIIDTIKKLINSPSKSKNNLDTLKISKDNIPFLDLSENNFSNPESLKKSPSKGSPVIERIKKEDKFEDIITDGKGIEKANSSKFSSSCSSQFKAKENKINKDFPLVIENQGYFR